MKFDILKAKVYLKKESSQKVKFDFFHNQMEMKLAASGYLPVCWDPSYLGGLPSKSEQLDEFSPCFWCPSSLKMWFILDISSVLLYLTKYFASICYHSSLRSFSALRFYTRKIIRTSFSDWLFASKSTYFVIICHLALFLVCF